MDLKSALLGASGVAAAVGGVLATLHAATDQDLVAAALAAISVAILTGAAGLFLSVRSAAARQAATEAMLSDSAAQNQELTAAVQLAVQHLSSLEFAHDATTRGLQEARLENTSTGQRVEDLGRSVGEMRAAGEQAQSSLEASVAALQQAVEGRLSTIDASLGSLGEGIGGVREGQESAAKAIDAAVAELFRRHHDSRLHRETLYAQIEALFAIYGYLQPTTGLPPFRNWAVSPDLARNVVEFVIRTSPELVVELGSGSSTVLIAMALAKQGHGRILSVEHDPLYATKTQEMLDTAGVGDWAQIVDAPMGEVEYDGNAMAWYDLAKLDLDRAIDLLIVDGPPGTTGPLARLPAAILFEHLADGGIVVLDDTKRDVERTIVEKWAQLPGVEIWDDQPLEKGATWFRVSRAE